MHKLSALLSTALATPHTTSSLPVPVFMLFGCSIFLCFWCIYIMAARKKAMEKAGTWLGVKSFAAEDAWNRARAGKRDRWLAAIGIDDDNPAHAELLATKWQDIPHEQRLQLFQLKFYELFNSVPKK